MNPTTQRLAFWTPRALCLLFAAFTSLFALDVFGEGGGAGQVAVALFMHLLPTLFLLGILALSWRWEWVGGTLYLGLGLLYVVWSWGKFGWMAPTFIAGPLFALSGLFWAGWIWRREIRAERSLPETA